MNAFRISVSLNNFFNDHRSLCYILIDNKFRTIEDVENHIKVLFNLECDICLVANNHLLPTTEEIYVLREGDSLHVSRINKNECLRKKSKTTEDDAPPQLKKRKLKEKSEVSIPVEDSSDEKDLKTEPENEQKTTKKKKRKKKKSVCLDEQATVHANESDHLNVDHKSIEILNVENVNMEVDTTNASKVGHTKTEIFLWNNESQSESISENAPVSNSKVEKEVVAKSDTSKKEESIVNGSKNGKTPSFSMGDFLNRCRKVYDCENKPPITNPESLFITKRRRRVRKRKSQKQGDNSAIHSDIEFDLRERLKTGSPSLHIRFDSEVDTNPLYSSTPNQDIPAKSALNKEHNTTVSITVPKYESNISDITNCPNKGESCNEKQNGCESSDVKEDFFNNLDLSNNLESIKHISVNREVPPNINDVIAFKLFEFNEKYEPSISNWIVGKVQNWNRSDGTVDFSILTGHVQSKVPNGKFSLEDEDPLIEDEGINKQGRAVTLNFGQLLEPRRLIIDY